MTSHLRAEIISIEIYLADLCYQSIVYYHNPILRIVV